MYYFLLFLNIIIHYQKNKKQSQILKLRIKLSPSFFSSEYEPVRMRITRQPEWEILEAVFYSIGFGLEWSVWRRRILLRTSKHRGSLSVAYNFRYFKTIVPSTLYPPVTHLSISNLLECSPNWSVNLNVSNTWSAIN